MTVVLAGYYGFENAGDELILAAIVREFKRTCPGERLIVLSSQPEVTRRAHGIEAVDRWSLRQVYSALGEAARFVMGGGGLFQDTTSMRSFLYYMALLVAAHFRSGSVALFAVGIENVRSFWSRRSLVFFLAQFKIPCYVRDDESEKRLKAWGVPPDQIHRSPDAAFLLGPIPRQQPQENSVLFIPRFPRPKGGDFLYRSTLEALKKQGVAVQILLLQPKLEIKSWRDFASWNKIEAPLISWEHASELIPILSSAALVVSARYHGLLVAELAGVPTIGLGAPEKTGRYCHEWTRPFLSWDSTASTIQTAIRDAAERFGSTERRPEISERAEQAKSSFSKVFAPSVDNS